jgi:hypothetical protein
MSKKQIYPRDRTDAQWALIQPLSLGLGGSEQTSWSGDVRGPQVAVDCGANLVGPWGIAGCVKKDYEQNPRVSETMVYMAMIHRLLRQLRTA